MSFLENLLVPVGAAFAGGFASGYRDFDNRAMIKNASAAESGALTGAWTVPPVALLVYLDPLSVNSLSVPVQAVLWGVVGFVFIHGVTRMGFA